MVTYFGQFLRPICSLFAAGISLTSRVFALFVFWCVYTVWRNFTLPAAENFITYARYSDVQTCLSMAYVRPQLQVILLLH